MRTGAYRAWRGSSGLSCLSLTLEGGISPLETSSFRQLLRSPNETRRPRLGRCPCYVHFNIFVWIPAIFFFCATFPPLRLHLHGTHPSYANVLACDRLSRHPGPRTSPSESRSHPTLFGIVFTYCNHTLFRSCELLSSPGFEIAESARLTNCRINTGCDCATRSFAG